MEIEVITNIADMYTTTIGIENINGSDGLQVFYNAGYFLDNFSIRINTNWLAVTPSSGFISSAENIVAPITIDTRYLDPGTYTGNIYLDSNDPNDSLISIPVSLTVLGGYEYLAGDANMAAGLWPPQVIGGDVTYLVGYFRGITESCLLDGLFASGDSNGDCSVIGSDVTYLVNYFRGLNDLQYCPDYEPAWLTHDDLPIDEPSGWPNCESMTISNEIIQTEDVKLR